MKYITWEEGYGEFCGHVYKVGNRFYRHQIKFWEIEPTKNSWEDTGKVLDTMSVRKPLMYQGNLYKWCHKDLEENTKPFNKLPLALQAAFHTFSPMELEYHHAGLWFKCVLKPEGDLIVRLRKCWRKVTLEGNTWKFLDGTKNLRDFLDRDIVYTKLGKYYLKKRDKWYRVKHEEGFPIIQEIDCPYFSIDPLIPIWVSM